VTPRSHSKVFSADSFQGNEAEYIAVSLVKDGRQGSTIRFLKVLNRTNVLLTRTSYALIIFTSKRFILGKAKDTMLGTLAQSGGDSLWVGEKDVLDGQARIPRKTMSGRNSSARVL